jgi:uncharacterized membrane protein YsdA (DUF1294 family)
MVLDFPSWFFPFIITAGIIGILVAIILFAFWVWMIVDCAMREYRNNVEKVIWLLAIIFFGWIGALVYFLVVRLINEKGLFKK